MRSLWHSYLAVNSSKLSSAWSPPDFLTAVVWKELVIAVLGAIVRMVAVPLDL